MNRPKKLVVFDSHPVQYRVPVWRNIEAVMPGWLHVVYASDCSVRGHADKGFGQQVAWDDPMLEGYEYTILNCEKGTPLSGPESLTGEGVAAEIERLKPDAILLTGLNYRYDKVAFSEAKKRKIPLWLRCETQDEAITRSKLKSIIRSVIYRYYYKGFEQMFYIGNLNRKHYLAHGVPELKLVPALYGTIDRFAGLTDEKKQQLRSAARDAAGIAPEAVVIGFSGKLIPKKHPDALLGMLEYLPTEFRKKVHLYFIGSGELKATVEQLAAVWEKKAGIKTHFTGFVNQSELAKHYLAIDILVLPSRRMGETWGLVANEAMQAGCSVVVSDAVGCYANFYGLERFRVFKEGDLESLAAQVKSLEPFDRSFNWALKSLEPYSIGAIASAFITKMKDN